MARTKKEVTPKEEIQETPDYVQAAAVVTTETVLQPTIDTNAKPVKQTGVVAAGQKVKIRSRLTGNIIAHSVDKVTAQHVVRDNKNVEII